MKRRSKQKWSYTEWIFAVVLSVLLPVSIYWAFEYKGITEVTFGVGLIGSFFTGKLFEKLR